MLESPAATPWSCRFRPVSGLTSRQLLNRPCFCNSASCAQRRFNGHRGGSPSRVHTQWQDNPPQLDHRCGGSTGIAPGICMVRWARSERRVVVTTACVAHCGVNAVGRTGFPFNPSGRIPSGHLKCNMEDTRQGASNASGAHGLLRHSRRQYRALPAAAPGRTVTPAA